VGQPYVYAVKSGHFEQELLSIIPLSKALWKPATLCNK
jgi:hypothetical protein